MKHLNKFIATFLVLFVIGLLILAGPASALTVELTKPNDAVKGNDVSFSFTVTINSEIAQIQYTNLVFTGPSGSVYKICKVNNDGSSDCPDISVTIQNLNVNYGYGYGYGYGYTSTGTGTLTYNVVWHTPSTLVDGIYTVKAVVILGSLNLLSSNEQSFTISSPSVSAGGGGGGGSSADNHPTLVTPTPAQEARTLEQPQTESQTGTTGNEGGITGAAVAETNTGNYVIAGILVLVILGIGFFLWKKRK